MCRLLLLLPLLLLIRHFVCRILLLYRYCYCSEFVLMRYSVSVYRTATVTVTVSASADEALCVVLVMFIPRTANMAADSMAALGRNVPLGLRIYDGPSK
ncbi:hypothetical protein PVK06_026371 [Gossypium arboreum]|uniref:Secreted protein n=1 Tax=Gossypium arboreum TaxID=29729 RepID=A0ABR0NXH8_GOSAR|nr:hypothetical protein PVK06_026371 [Gossypium arboreum]